ncbi:hypothetical protein FJZ36_09960 [Candidatus Poribacteria bacterium]|nr:hypothetical protein [Candidatus Poribacteria bacterium]
MTLLDRYYRRQIPAYLEGTLRDRARRRLEARLRASEPLRRELAVYERLTRVVSVPVVEYPSEFARARVIPRLHERIERDYAFGRSRRPTRAQWLLLGFGGIEVAAAALLLSWGIGIGRSWSAANELLPTAEIAAPTPAVSATASSPIDAIGEAWVPAKLAAKLAALDLDRSIAVAAPTEPQAVDEAVEPLPAVQDAAPTVAAAPATDSAETFRRIMEISLPPTGLYGEEASYLVASRP